MEKKREEKLPPHESINRELHPILTRKYTLVTPMMRALVSEIVQWIKTGTTGGIVSGSSRVGKTKTRRFVAQTLPDFFPRLPTYSLIARLYKLPSERVFFGDMLKAFKHAMHAEGTAAQRRDRLVEGVVNIAQTSGQDRVVLLIDQAHNLLETHYEWLVDFYEELNERGIELSVFLFGQKELITTYEELRRAGKNQIIARFMADRMEYFGIRSVNELKACLVCYDERSRFPEDSDWTYTRYFVPEAFAHGWRLASHADTFWKVFEEVNRRRLVPGRMEVTLQHFARTVERFLVDVELSDTGEPILSHSSLVQFVVATFDVPRPHQYSSLSDEEDDEEADEQGAKR